MIAGLNKYRLLKMIQYKTNFTTRILMWSLNYRLASYAVQVR